MAITFRMHNFQIEVSFFLLLLDGSLWVLVIGWEVDFLSPRRWADEGSRAPVFICISVVCANVLCVHMREKESCSAPVGRQGQLVERKKEDEEKIRNGYEPSIDFYTRQVNINGCTGSRDWFARLFVPFFHPHRSIRPLLESISYLFLWAISGAWDEPTVLFASRDNWVEYSLPQCESIV